MSFFRANDATEELAKEIASEGKVWSKSFWRHEDMVSYQFRWVQVPVDMLAYWEGVYMRQDKEIRRGFFLGERVEIAYS